MGFECEFLSSHAKFDFANSQKTQVKEKIRVWFNTDPKPCYTDIDICEEGHAPILFSLPQQCNLRFSWEMSPDQVLLTSKAFGYERYPVCWSTSRHLVINLADLRHAELNTLVADTQYDPLYHGRYPTFMTQRASLLAGTTKPLAEVDTNKAYPAGKPNLGLQMDCARCVCMVGNEHTPTGQVVSTTRNHHRPRRTSPGPSG